MTFLRILLALGAAYVGQLLGTRLTPWFPALVDLFLVVVVWYALHTRSAVAQLIGAAAGLLHDGLTGGLFGLHAFANTVVAYGVAAAAQRVEVQQQAVRVLLFAAASALQQGLVLLLLLLLTDAPDAPGWGWALGRVAITAMLGAVLVGIESRLRSRWSRWQHARSSRLRFR
ncbi:MAG TPA: rod shape-determining protein MreD [Thermoanaerobaculia bacterium]|nr:rod shape-determining protein MreD [Thermoanaerobaculia bacterium]